MPTMRPTPRADQSTAFGSDTCNVAGPQMATAVVNAVNFPKPNANTSYEAAGGNRLAAIQG